MNSNQKLVIAIGVPALLCCVCTGFGAFGVKIYGNEVCGHLATLEGVKEHLGTPLTKCSVDYGPTLTIKDNDTWVFQLAGSKGSGKAWVRSVTGESGSEEFSGTLLEVGGKEYLLEGEAPPKQ